MGAEAKRKGKTSSSKAPKQPGTRKPRKLRRAGIAEFRQLAIHYILTGKKTESCIVAGLSPRSSSYIFSLDKVQKLIEELRPAVEESQKKHQIDSAVDKYEITEEFLDSNLADLIVNGPTHFMRGDADRVKGIEIGYKKLGKIDVPRISVNAQAAAIAGAQAGGTMRAVYKSKWLIDKENEMKRDFEKEIKTIPAALPSAPAPADRS